MARPNRKEAPSYSLLSVEGFDQTQRGSRIILRMHADRLPELLELRSMSPAFAELLSALDAGTVKPEHTEPELSRLRVELSRLAIHQRAVEDACEHVFELDAWGELMEKAMADYRPNRVGICACPACYAARARRPVLVP
jgi:hypothetical protein